MRKIKNKNTKLDKKIKKQFLSPTELALSLAQLEKNHKKRTAFFLSVIFDVALSHLKKHRKAWDEKEAYLKPVLKGKLTKSINKLEQFIEKTDYRKIACEIMSNDKYEKGLKIIAGNYKNTNLKNQFFDNDFKILVNLEFAIAWLDLLKERYINGIGNIGVIFDDDRDTYNKAIKGLNEYITFFLNDIDMNFVNKNNKSLSIIA